MTTIYTLFPEVLNLNGDSANSLVLQKNLQWMGEQAQNVVVSNEAALLELMRRIKAGQMGIFVTIGHGSVAGMKSLAGFDGLIRELIELMVETKTPAIVVGSALAWARADTETNRERRSKFIVAEVHASGWPPTGLGYLNSDRALEPILVKSNVILTLLHGPFFAKNPEWVARVTEILGLEPTENASKTQADVYVDEIWRLESDH